ncbi:glycoside hydrolase family 47 protein [Lipomyces japonicus]|uniref:glycoside hydrolase family 47 protein n=1 Tax=Lipomyces japonicus TaxID=56871 RepID=UPI0034CFBB2D
MFSLLRLRRYRSLLIIACVAVVILYQIASSRRSNDVAPEKFFKGSSSLPEKRVKPQAAHVFDKTTDIFHDVEKSDDPTIPRKGDPTPPKKPIAGHDVVLENSPIGLSSFEGSYSPDDTRRGRDISTTPYFGEDKVDVFSTPKIIKFPIANPVKLPEEPPQSLPKVQGTFAAETPEEREVRESRLATVKEAFKHSWEGYKKYAWGHDELRPVSRGFADPFGGWGATIVDALDTLIIMELDSELEQAKKFVETIDFERLTLPSIPVFETTIRYLGGLIGAYDLSQQRESLFLKKAVELADILIDAFDTPNGMPVLFYDPQLAHRPLKLRAGKSMVLAQFASLSLEFTRLAQITSNNTYYSVIQRITDQLDDASKQSVIPGLWPLRMDISGCETALSMAESDSNGASHSSTDSRLPKGIAKDNNPDLSSPELQRLINNAAGAVEAAEKTKGNKNKQNKKTGNSLNKRQLPSRMRSEKTAEMQPSTTPVKYSAGALGDSAYEYLIKEYILLGGNVEQYKRLYEKSIVAIQENIIYRPLVQGTPDILFAGNVIVGGNGKKEMDFEMTHLSCYIGGMFALGAKTLEHPSDLITAQKLTDGCYWAYNTTRTGIMSENFHVNECISGRCEFIDPQARKQAGPRLTKRQTIRVAESPSSEAELDNDRNRWEVGGWYDQPRSYLSQDGRYLLRPEALESIFILYRVTGDKKWQDKGWEMFSAINKWCRTEIAYSAIQDVTNNNQVKHLDQMESFWMAETLKYAYLLFSEPGILSLDDYVFNTEAHPFLRPSPVTEVLER